MRKQTQRTQVTSPSDGAKIWTCIHSASKLENHFPLWQKALSYPGLSFFRYELCHLGQETISWVSVSSYLLFKNGDLVAQTVKCLSTMRETRVRSLGREDPLEKETAIHSSTTAWKIPWTEEPGRLQSMGSQRVGHDWETFLYRHEMIVMKRRKKMLLGADRKGNRQLFLITR